jgi:hypothetical protein
MSAPVRLEAVIVAVSRFLASPDIGFRSPLPGALCVAVIDVAVRTASRSARRACRPLSFCRGQGYSSGLLNFAAHSPEDSQRDRKFRSARLERTVPKGLFQYRTAGPRAFSLTSRITQRDAETGSGRSGQPRPPRPGELNRSGTALP